MPLVCRRGVRRPRPLQVAHSAPRPQRLARVNRSEGFLLGSPLKNGKERQYKRVARFAGGGLSGTERCAVDLGIRTRRTARDKRKARDAPSDLCVFIKPRSHQRPKIRVRQAQGYSDEQQMIRE